MCSQIAAQLHAVTCKAIAFRAVQHQAVVGVHCNVIEEEQAILVQHGQPTEGQFLAQMRCVSQHKAIQGQFAGMLNLASMRLYQALH